MTEKPESIAGESKPNNSNLNSTANIKKPNKGYSNPALAALGIPRLRLPSRNWSIFLLLVGGISGGIFYDRYERKANRKKWCDIVSPIASQSCASVDVLRKVTIYYASPPGDGITPTRDHFRQYVKPILNAGAIEFEVVEGYTQGEIRTKVADRIRIARKKLLGLSPDGEDEEDIVGMLQRINSLLNRDTSGGILCIGRGAYKEYLDGFHEGWLGPLDEPKVETLKVEEVKVDEQSKVNIEKNNEIKDNHKVEEISDVIKPNENKEGTKIEEKDETKKDDSEETEKPIARAPYILPSEFSQQSVPKEFYSSYHEPIVFIPHPHILGIRNTPIRIYRFFTRRKLADDVGSITASAVLGFTRRFNNQVDPGMGVWEEDEWPTGWKEKALEKGSEWMWDMKVDERISSKLNVYTLRSDIEYPNKTRAELEIEALNTIESEKQK